MVGFVDVAEEFGASLAGGRVAIDVKDAGVSSGNGEFETEELEESVFTGVWDGPVGRLRIRIGFWN